VFGRAAQRRAAIRRRTATLAYHAANDPKHARVELQKTSYQIDVRADNIAAPFWKNSFLTRNPYCVRARELAQEWDVKPVAH
jgi:hypothetical protein